MHICKPGALSLHGHAPKLCKSAPCWFYCSLRQEANSMDEVPPVERSDTRRTLVTSIVRLDKAPKELRYRTEAKRSMNILLPTIGRICPNILFGGAAVGCGWLGFHWFSLFLLVSGHGQGAARRWKHQQKGIKGAKGHRRTGCFVQSEFIWFFFPYKASKDPGGHWKKLVVASTRLVWRSIGLKGFVDFVP